MADLDHTFGYDLTLNASGDLLTADGLTLSEQRVLRRLLTTPGEYIWEPTYGAGLPAYVGSPINAQEVRTLILAQMRLEASVAWSPEPTVTVTPIANGMAVDIRYIEVDTGQPVLLSFDVTP